MADKIQLLIEAILSKTSEAQLEQELKKIEKKLPKLNIEADLNAQTQLKLYKSLQKIYKDEEKQRLQQEKLAEQAMKQREKQLQYEQKVRLALEKQQQKELELEQKIREQREQAELKYWSQRRKEAVEALTSKSNELQRMKEYYTQLEKTSKQEFEAKVKVTNALEKQKQKELENNRVIQERIALFQKEISLKSQSLLRKYGDSVDKIALQAINDEVLKLTTESFSQEAKTRINQLFKEVEIGAKNSSEILRSNAKDAKTWGDQLAIATKKFIDWMIVGTYVMQSVRAFKQGVQTVVSLDASLTELNKVADLTVNQLKSITNEAYKAGTAIGRTGREVVDATTEFKRAGFDINEAFDLSQQALLLTNIGDGIDDVKEASSSIIAVLKGFKMEATEASHVIDALNEVSNNFAVDTNNLTEILKRVSGTIAQTGASYEELLGLATGGFESLRNAEMVASGINMISQRLRGMTEDGEAVEDLIPKIQAAFDKYTKGAVSIIDKQNGGLHSTYEILQQLSKVYPTLTDEAKAYLNEAIAGNRQNKVLVAIMENWSNVEKAVEAAKNSTGSAIKENEKYLNSINGKIAQFSSSVEKLWYNTIDSNTIKTIIDVGTTIVSLIDKFGLLNTAIIGTITYFTFFKTSMAITPIINTATIAISKLTAGLNLSTAAAIKLNTVLGMLAPVAIAGAIMGIVKAIDHLTVTLEEQQQKVQELSNEYDNLKSKINSLENELKTTASRIDELNSKDKLSIVEQDELEKLKLSNQELEARIKLLNKQAELTAKNLAKEALTLYERQQTTGEVSRARVNEIKSLSPNNALLLNSNDLNELLAAYENLIELQKEATDPSDVEHYANLMDIVKERINNQSLALMDIRDKLKELQNPTEQQKQKIEEINKSLKITQSLLDPQVAFENAWKSLNQEQQSYIQTLNSTNKLTITQIQQYSELFDLIKNGSFTFNDLKKSISSTNQAQEENIKNIEFTIKKTEELDKLYKDTTSNLEDLNQAIYDVSQGEALSAKQVEELILKYPQLEQYIRKTADGYTIEKDAIEVLNQVRQQSVNTALLAQAGITQAAYDGLRDRLKAYEIEIESIHGIADAYRLLMPYLASGSSSQLIRDTLEYAKALEKIKTLRQTLSDPTYGVKQSTSKSKSSSTSTRSETEIKQIEIDKFYKLQEAIDRTNNSIENNKKLLSNTDEDEEKIAILEKLISLYKEQQKQLHNIAEARRNAIEDNIKELKGYGFDISYDRITNDLRIANEEHINKIYGKNNEETNKLREKLKDIIDQTKKWNKANIEAGSEWQNLAGYIKGAYNDINDIYKKQEEALVKQTEEQRKLWEDSNKTIIDLLKKRYQKEKDLREKNYKETIKRLDDELNAYKKYINDRLEELDRLYSTEDYQKNVAEKSKEILDVQAEIDKYMMAAQQGDLEAIARIKELNKEKLKLQSELQDTQTKRERELMKQTLKDQLSDFEEYIKAKKDDEEKNFEEYKQRLEESMSETALALEAQKMLMTGTISEVRENLIQLFTDVGENATITGKLIQDELISKIAQLQNIGNNLSIVAGMSGNNKISNIINSSINSLMNVVKSFVPSSMSNIVNNYITNQVVPRQSTASNNEVNIGDINISVTGNATVAGASKLAGEIVSQIQNVMYKSGNVKR